MLYASHLADVRASLPLAPVLPFVSVTWLACVPLPIERNDICFGFCGGGGLSVRSDDLLCFGLDEAYCSTPSPVIFVVWEVGSGSRSNAVKLAILRRSGWVSGPMCLGPVVAAVTGAPEPLSGRLTDHISLGVLSAVFSRDLIEEVLGVTGKRERRSRLLPAHVMVRYVIALGLFFGQAYEEVMRQMTGTLQSLGSWDQGWAVPSTPAITQARQRLGAGPLRELFHRAAVPVAGLGTRGAWLRGRRLMALDGTSFDVPDTAGNVAAFGKMGSGPKESAFPKLQVVSLSECATHAQVAAAMGSCRTGERELAAQLAGPVDEDMLITADSGFYSWQLWDLFAATGAALCWRAGAAVPLPLVRRLPDGSYLALIFAPGATAKRKAALLAAARAGEQIDEDRARIVRAAEYTVPDRGAEDSEHDTRSQAHNTDLRDGDSRMPAECPIGKGRCYPRRASHLAGRWSASSCWPSVRRAVTVRGRAA